MSPRVINPSIHTSFEFPDGGCSFLTCAGVHLLHDILLDRSAAVILWLLPLEQGALLVHVLNLQRTLRLGRLACATKFGQTLS